MIPTTLFWNLKKTPLNIWWVFTGINFLATKKKSPKKYPWCEIQVTTVRVKVCQCQRKFHWNSQDSMLSQKTRKKITNQKVPSKNKKTHPKIVWKPPPTHSNSQTFFQANEHFLSWLCLYPLAAHTKLSAASRFGFAHAFRMRAWKKDKIKSAKKKNNSLFPPIERFGSFFVFETFFCSWDLFLAFWKPKTRLFPIHSKTHVPTIPNQTSWWLQPISKNHESETWIISSRVSGEHKKWWFFNQPTFVSQTKNN